MLSFTLLVVVMTECCNAGLYSANCCYADFFVKCRSSECRYVECHYVECCDTESHYASSLCAVRVSLRRLSLHPFWS
jgi:hypothetical protein